MRKSRLIRASVSSGAAIIAALIVLGVHSRVVHAGYITTPNYDWQPPSPASPSGNLPLYPGGTGNVNMSVEQIFYDYSLITDPGLVSTYSCQTNGQTLVGGAEVTLSWPVGGGAWDSYYSNMPQGQHQYLQAQDYLFAVANGKYYWDGFIMAYDDQTLLQRNPGAPNGYIMAESSLANTLAEQMEGNVSWEQTHFFQYAYQNVSGGSNSGGFGSSNSFSGYEVLDWNLVHWLSGAVTVESSYAGTKWMASPNPSLWAAFCDTSLNQFIEEVLFAPTLQSNILSLSAKYPTVVAGQNEIIHVVGAQYTYETQAHLEAAELIGPNGTTWFTKSDFQNDYGTYPGGGSYIWDPYSAGYSQAFAQAFSSGPHDGGPNSEQNPDDMVWIKGGRPGGYGSAVNYISENMTLNTTGWAPGTYKLNLWELDQFARGNLSQYDPTTGYSPPIEFAA
ncbi:hypothetical protein [Alicyclobacillus acidocaldarius]|uniref:Uncharacterized protein n=1 Tax=Alicyclobacillus acidocaldarius subsp. acidocaldarius (strain ATCC 27009 / DSM 446 / BCRC 14685 / JCM 5260 / KCTC 1825 / NBRC 15652 / NCIMB 11725 / NRRL B-14509 / 104-IA) TaxID=521098 RepID=C8WT33_ALIAD|nr:hypothetical protein [Alicyclobacillus acidocaldarius]ACV59548.1 hypothetical protein Aaci_2543 [Alicyclobacillus acidocaldarius subsp. acidocaldarius DSM 446]